MRRLAPLAALVLLTACDEKPAPAKPAAQSSAPPAPAKAEAAAHPAAAPAAPAAAGSAAPAADGSAPIDADALAVAEDGKAYGQVLIKTTSAENHIAELTIVRDEGVKARSGMVRYTAEPWVVVAPGQDTLAEANLLGTGVAVDLDGDGKTTGSFSSKCDGEAAVVGTKPPVRLAPAISLSDSVATFDYGENDSKLQAFPSAGALLYAPCETGQVVAALDPKGPLKLLEVPSPAVFVVYRTEVDAVDAEDPFALQKVNAGEVEVQHQLYSFREFNVQDGGTKVYAAHLVVFAIDPTKPLQHVSLEIGGTKPEFVTASINEVDAQGRRIRYADGFRPFGA